MKASLMITVLLSAASEACYLICHSSKVGNWDCQHSEPSDHGGAAQYVDWTHDGCTIKGQIFDGCGVTVSSAVGCGTVSFSINHPGRLARMLKV